MKHVMIVHGTDEWRDNRRGNICCSELAPLAVDKMPTQMNLTSQTSLWQAREALSAGQKTYLHELLAARLGGREPVAPRTKAILHGIDNEPVARETFANRWSVEVETSGLLRHPEIPSFVGTPDGLLNTFTPHGQTGPGGIEIKSLESHRHVGAVLEQLLLPGTHRKEQVAMTTAERKALKKRATTASETVDFVQCPADKLPQIRGYMALTGRRWWVYVSHDPDIEPPLDLLCRVVPWTPKVDELLDRIRWFAQLVDAMEHLCRSHQYLWAAGEQQIKAEEEFNRIAQEAMENPEF